MEIVLDSKLVLLLRLCSLLHIASATYYDQYYEPSNNQDSESHENTSDMDQKLEHQSMRFNRNRDINYNNSPKPSIQQPVQVMPMSQMASMSMPMQIQMPMQMPQPPSQPIPQMLMQMSQPPSQPIPQMPMPMPQIGMPQMPQMPIPSMQMPQMPMPSMPMSQMSMPMLPMSMPMLPMAMQTQRGPFGAPLPGQFPGSNLVYFPIASQYTNFLKNMPPSRPPPVNQVTTLSNPNSVITTTTTQAKTTTTTQATTTTLTALPVTQPTTTVTESQSNIYRRFSNLFLKSQGDQNNILASVLKNAIEDYSHSMVKPSERTNNVDNRYTYASLRKTKPTWMPKYGIVPISGNMAQRLMTQMRGVRRRPKRLAILEIE